MSRIAIFTAMNWECRPILACLGAAQRQKHGPATIWRCTRAGNEIWVVKTGIGLDRAGRAALGVLERARFDLAVSSGCAGALVPELDVGDLVIATVVVEPAEKIRRDSDARARAQALDTARAAGLRVAQGPVASQRTVLASPASKQSIAAAHAAIAVDMESAAIAAGAAAHKVPFLLVRAVLDRLDTEMPSEVLVGPDGRVRPLEVARRLATHPGDLVRLWALRGMTAVVQRTLQTFFTAWLPRGGLAMTVPFG